MGKAHDRRSLSAQDIILQKQEDAFVEDSVFLTLFKLISKQIRQVLFTLIRRKPDFFNGFPSQNIEIRNTTTIVG